MANQYEVLGKATVSEDLKKLSPSNVHLTFKNLNIRTGSKSCVYLLNF